MTLTKYINTGSYKIGHLQIRTLSRNDNMYDIYLINNFNYITRKRAEKITH